MTVGFTFITVGLGVNHPAVCLCCNSINGNRPERDVYEQCAKVDAKRTSVRYGNPDVPKRRGASKGASQWTGKVIQSGVTVQPAA
jgi:hypothetical protein